jgi:magnesium transporter
MLHVLRRGQAACQTEQPGPDWRLDDDVLWIDLLKPTREEELAVEAALGLQLPTVEEMEALEPSSRLYQEAGATFMTATLMARGDEPAPFATPATFVLAQGRLVTLRYETLKAFTISQTRAPEGGVGSGTAALMGLLDAHHRAAGPGPGRHGRSGRAGLDGDLQAAGRRRLPAAADGPRPGAVGDRATPAPAWSASRALLSFAGLAHEIAGDAECRAHLRSQQRDAQSLTDHADHQSSHVAFLLDAALA